MGGIATLELCSGTGCGHVPELSAVINVVDLLTLQRSMNILLVFKIADFGTLFTIKSLIFFHVILLLHR